ncbi:MAG: GTP 3',8-cyclase MoaA [Chitinophagaceae bacterium]|nr:GTP 3',8-cyclase MoaA [Chitinophagaceae bacterium]
MLTDTHQRFHNYLRISLTDACNFRCFYCMPDEEIAVTPHAALMQMDELVAMAKTFVELGVTKIRLTGGEPLVRKDVGKIIKALGKLPVKLTMTTNGVLVHKFIDVFKEAGLKSINVSLDTLDPMRFLALTKRDQFNQVFENIELLVREGFSVKVNVVAMKGINESEINRFVAWTKDKPIHIRFIEFMPFTDNAWQSKRVLTYQEILEIVSTAYTFIKLQDELHDTTKKYQVEGHQGTFAVISTMTAPFCSSCNRIRLTADGKLKNCLFSKHETDLLTAFRQGENIIPLIAKNIQQKQAWLGGQLASNYEQIDTSELDNRSMISIGG